MTTTEYDAGEFRISSWQEIAGSLRTALDQVEALGVPWRGTRFDRYLRKIEDLASLSRDEILARPGTTLASEALRQADQLTEASALFASLEKELLVEKLRTIVSGADLHVDPETDDRPRNTLFELMTGRVLSEHGFTVALTRDAEDLIATHPRLRQKISIECKRPAHSAPEQIEARIVRNLVKIRDQLMLRPRGNIRMGVVAMDGPYRMRDQLPTGSNHEAIARMLRRALEEAVADIRRLNRTRRLRLESSMHIGAVILLGLGQDRNAVGYALRITRAFFLGNHPEIRKAMADVFGVELP